MTFEVNIDYAVIIPDGRAIYKANIEHFLLKVDVKNNGKGYE